MDLPDFGHELIFIYNQLMLKRKADLKKEYAEADIKHDDLFGFSVNNPPEYADINFELLPYAFSYAKRFYINHILESKYLEDREFERIELNNEFRFNKETGVNASLKSIADNACEFKIDAYNQITATI